VGTDKFDSGVHQIDDTSRQESATLRAEFAKLGESLRAEINAAKSEMIRWMFILWLGQAGTTAGIVFAVVKALK
jgi:hypothetical protein